MSAAAFAVCLVRDTADGAHQVRACRWPLGTGDVHSYELLHGPFDSEIEACAELLVHVGAYPATDEGRALAFVFVQRVKTRTQQLNDYVAEQVPSARLLRSVGHVATTRPAPAEPILAEVRTMPPAGATILPALPYEPPPWHDAAAAQIGERA